MARLLLLAAVGDQARAEHPDPDHVKDPRHLGAGDLLVDGHLLDRPQPLPAELPRRGDAPGCPPPAPPPPPPPPLPPRGGAPPARPACASRRCHARRASV